MIVLPIETPNHADDVLIIVLGDDSLERMARADPAEVKCKELGRNLINPRVVICHEKDSPEFARLLQARNLSKICEFLSRGFAFRPDKGDHDRGPTPLNRLN